MTPQQIATERLRGWHAAQSLIPMDEIEGPLWIEGYNLWINRVSPPKQALQHSLALRVSEALRRIGLTA